MLVFSNNRYYKYLPDVTLEGSIVFPAAKNQLMTRSAFVYFWGSTKAALLREGRRNGEDEAFLKGVTPHTFRHTYATTLYYAGIDVKAAQYLLGHATVGMTLDLYTHLELESNTSVLEKLNAQCIPKKNLKVVK